MCVCIEKSHSSILLSNTTCISNLFLSQKSNISESRRRQSSPKLLKQSITCFSLKKTLSIMSILFDIENIPKIFFIVYFSIYIFFVNLYINK